MLSANAESFNTVYNVAVGENYTVNFLYEKVREFLKSDWQPVYREARAGDIRNSLADISRAENLLGYKPTRKFEDGLRETIDYFRDTYSMTF